MSSNLRSLTGQQTFSTDPIYHPSTTMLTGNLSKLSTSPTKEYHKVSPFIESSEAIRVKEGGWYTTYQFSWRLVEKKCIAEVLRYINDIDDAALGEFLGRVFEKHQKMILDDQWLLNSTTEKFINYLVKKIKPTLPSAKAAKFENFFTWEVFSYILQSLEKESLEEGNFVVFLNARSEEIEEYLKRVEDEFDERVEKSLSWVLQQNIKDIPLYENTIFDDWLSQESDTVRNAMNGFFSYLRYLLALNKLSEQSAEQVFLIPNAWFIDILSKRIEIVTEQKEVWQKVEKKSKDGAPAKDKGGKPVKERVMIIQENLVEKPQDDIEFFTKRTAYIEDLLFNKVMQISKELSNPGDNDFRKRVRPSRIITPPQDQKLPLQESREFLEDVSDRNASSLMIPVETFVNKFFLLVHDIFLEKRQPKPNHAEPNAEFFVTQCVEEVFFLNNCEEYINLFFKEYETEVLKQIKETIFEKLKSLFPLDKITLQRALAPFKVKKAKNNCEGKAATPALAAQLKLLVPHFQGAFTKKFERMPNDVTSCISQFLCPEGFAYFLGENRCGILEKRFQIINEFKYFKCLKSGYMPITLSKQDPNASSNESIVSSTESGSPGSTGSGSPSSSFDSPPLLGATPPEDFFSKMNY